MKAQPVSLRQWVREHDESWIFVVLYLGLAVGLSVFVSLFWLVLVAVLHFGLELLRQSHYRDGRRSVALHALWEVKLDVGLVLLALTLVLYIDVVLGILGLQSAARAAAVSRAGVRIGSRAAAWERNLRTFLLTMDEMVRIIQAGFMLGRKRRTKNAASIAAGDGAETEQVEAALVVDSGAAEGERASADRNEDEDEAPAVPIAIPAWSARWGWGDRIGLALVVVGIVLLVTAPFLTDHGWASAAALLMEELRPFPS